MIQLLLVDDHTLFREGLKQIFSDTNDIVVAAEASSGQEALNKIKENNCDVVILDISMPDMNGINVLKQIRKLKFNVPILILSMYSEEQYAISAYQAGADGYLTKSEAPKELLNAVRKVASGGKYVGEGAAEKLVTSLNGNNKFPYYKKLSHREYQVMLMIGKGKSIKKISEELNLRSSTVSTLKARMFKKLKMKNNEEIVKYVNEEGLIKEEDFVG
jgi:two-component system invasion response regulator UvrY